MKWYGASAKRMAIPADEIRPRRTVRKNTMAVSAASGKPSRK
jgi:hypothetical protein